MLKFHLSKWLQPANCLRVQCVKRHKAIIAPGLRQLVCRNFTFGIANVGFVRYDHPQLTNQLLRFGTLGEFRYREQSRINEMPKKILKGIAVGAAAGALLGPMSSVAGAVIGGVKGAKLQKAEDQRKKAAIQKKKEAAKKPVAKKKSTKEKK